ncbi:MAG: hypothetical protein AABZ55_07775 [Bdellovibrionota bacterium]
MADEDEYKRRRRREEEREKEEEEEQKAKAKKEGTGSINLKSGDVAEKLDEAIRRAEILTEQVNNLYLQYFSGAQKLPPEEKRKQLEQLMYSISTIHKPTAALLFRHSNLHTNYNNHKDRWDKTLKDIETGKLKRPQLVKLR